MAMGLGDISSSSPLGRPLQATIEITSDPDQFGADELRIRQLDTKQAKNLGIELAGIYKSYLFKLVDKDGKLIVEVTSRKPVNEPFLNFLVELTWVTGKVYREYTLLLDPVLMTSEPPSPEKSRRVSPINASSEIGEASLNPSDESYRVRSGDSLSKIAASLLSGSNNSRQGMMKWLVQNNPKAFVNGDMNRLKAGALLSLPAGDGIDPASLAATPRQTVQRSSAANNKLVTSKKTETQAVDVSEPAGDEAKERLSIVTQGTGLGGATVDASEAARIIELQGQVAVTNDIVERLRRENQAMRERMLAIEKSDYVTSLERLVLLKEEEANELRTKLDNRDEEQQTDVSTAKELEQDSEKKPMVSEGAGQRLWILGLLIIALVGAVYFFYRWRNREQLKSSDQAGSRSDDKGLLEELDKIIASRSRVDNSAYKEPVTDATVVADTFEAFNKIGNAGIDAPTKTKTAAGANRNTGSNIGAAAKPEIRRSDEIVKKSILEKTLDYTPPEMEEFDLDLPEPYSVDDVISDAIAAANRGAFDVAEALLHAEQSQQAVDSEMSDAKTDSRLAVTLQYIAKLREADGDK